MGREINQPERSSAQWATQVESVLSSPLASRTDLAVPTKPTARPKLDELERVQPKTRAAWRAWLETHHRVSPGVWLVTFKKGHDDARISWDDAVEELLCVGWIDSKPQKLDEARSMLLCTPRKPKSAWSAINKQRVEKLVEAGLMRERGLEMIALAKRTGTWTALDAVSALTEPDDLRARLDATPAARAHWDAFPPSIKRGILEWIQNAKRAETRAQRVGETATLAARNERANQWRGRAAK